MRSFTIAALLLSALALPALGHEPTLENVRGVWVMNLYGTRMEMARQHGLFVRDKIPSTVLPFFAHKISNAINQSYLVKDFPVLGPVAREAIDVWVALPLRRGLPKSDQHEFAAFSLASGFNLHDTLNAAVVPDVGQWLTTSIFGGNKPTLGCSSVILPEGSQGLIHARNLDYEGFGIFDANPVVIHFHPSEPGAQDYVAVTSLGVHTAGITGSNASGITLDLHQTLVGAVSRFGTPILSTTARVVREARTLDQALSILTSARFAGSWMVVLSSAREHRAAVVEVSADGTAVRLMDGKNHLAVTNHVLTPWMAKKEFSVDYGFFTSSRERLRLLDREADATVIGGRATAQVALDMISSKPVTLATNIQSVVFVPERNLLYVATDPVSHAKPNDGTYVALSLDGKTAVDGARDPDLTRSNPLTAEQIGATALLREAAQISTEEGRYEDAAAILGRATRLDTLDPTYPLLEGLTLARAAPAAHDEIQKIELSLQAKSLLDEAERRGLDPYPASLVHLMRGRLADARGAREEALHEYRAVDRTLWRPLTKAAEKGLKKPYSLHDLRKIVVDYERNDLFRF